jgi:hypothetical protein
MKSLGDRLTVAAVFLALLYLLGHMIAAGWLF